MFRSSFAFINSQRDMLQAILVHYLHCHIYTHKIYTIMLHGLRFLGLRSWALILPQDANSCLAVMSPVENLVQIWLILMFISMYSFLPIILMLWTAVVLSVHSLIVPHHAAVPGQIQLDVASSCMPVVCWDSYASLPHHCSC